MSRKSAIKGKRTRKIQCEVMSVCEILTTVLFLLDADANDTEDSHRIIQAFQNNIRNFKIIGATPMIFTTRAAPDSELWYKSRSVTEKLQEFHSKYAAVPTDYDAKALFERLVGNLREYLRKNNFCDREEYAGNCQF